MEDQLQAVTRLVEVGVEFGVAYGLQLFGALVILLIGLKAAGWAGKRDRLNLIFHCILLSVSARRCHSMTAALVSRARRVP